MPRPTLDGTLANTRRQRTDGTNIGISGLPMLLTPAEAARQLSLSRYTIYEQVRAGSLQAKRYGRVILIPREELERFALSLETK